VRGPVPELRRAGAAVRRPKLADLIGAIVVDATDEGDGINLGLQCADGVTRLACVMCDPEGNGPGSLHLYDNRTGEYLGPLGGR